MGPVGVKAMTKFWAIPAAMLSGVVSAPTVALPESVAWKLNVAGTFVTGDISHTRAWMSPPLMIVANAVAVEPT